MSYPSSTCEIMLAEWIRGGRLVVSIVVSAFFNIMCLGFAWFFAVRNIYEGICLSLLISSLLSLYIWFASLVLLIKGKEEGIFK